MTRKFIIFSALVVGFLACFLFFMWDSFKEKWMIEEKVVWIRPIASESVEICGPGLLQNWDFEQEDNHAWHCSNFQKSEKFVDGVGRQGSRGVVLSITPNEATDSFWQNVSLDELPATLLVEGWIKTEDVEGF